jgi:chromosome segregation ATPase
MNTSVDVNRTLESTGFPRLIDNVFDFLNNQKNNNSSYSATDLNFDDFNRRRDIHAQTSFQIRTPVDDEIDEGVVRGGEANFHMKSLKQMIQMKQEIDTLNQIIDQLFQLSKSEDNDELESARMRPEDKAAVIMETLSLQKELINRQRIELELETGRIETFQQTIRNYDDLISNRDQQIETMTREYAQVRVELEQRFQEDRVKWGREKEAIVGALDEIELVNRTRENDVILCHREIECLKVKVSELAGENRKLTKDAVECGRRVKEYKAEAHQLRDEMKQVDMVRRVEEESHKKILKLEKARQEKLKSEVENAKKQIVGLKSKVQEVENRRRILEQSFKDRRDSDLELLDLRERSKCAEKRCREKEIDLARLRECLRNKVTQLV